MKSKSRFDIQQVVTDSIVKSIEEGGLMPWKCPWTKTGISPFPNNFQSKQDYNGINILILWARAAQCGFSTNSWLTYKQAEAMGGQVRKGEKSVMCVFAKPIVVDDKDRLDDDGKPEKRQVYCYKPFSVFNVEQIDGLDSLPVSTEPQAFDEDDKVAEFDAIAKQYCKNSGVTIRYGGDQAYYSPTLDIVKLPNTFKTSSGYVSTLAHELIHSTGHKKRFNRFDGESQPFKVHREKYAFEELIACLGESFVCAELGILGEHEQHAAYIQSWLKSLKSDKTFIFKAATQAGKAHRFLMNAAAENQIERAA